MINYILLIAATIELAAGILCFLNFYHIAVGNKNIGELVNSLSFGFLAIFTAIFFIWALCK